MMRTPTPGPSTWAASVLVAAALALSACTGEASPADDPQPSRSTAEPEALPMLEQLWSHPVAGGAGAEAPRLRAVSKDLVLLWQAEGLAGLDPSTGAERWSLGRTVCSISGRTPDDTVALTFRTAAPAGADSTCDRVGVLDLSDGELEWQTEVGAGVTASRPGLLSVGDHTLGLRGPDPCAPVHRFDLATGTPLPAFPTGSHPCLTLSGDLVVGTEQVGPRQRLVARALDTGRVLFRTSAAGARVQRIVTTDPLVLEVRRGPKRTLREIDRRTGTTLRTLGTPPGAGAGAGETTVGVLNGVLVCARPRATGSGPAWGLDLATGTSLWSGFPGPSGFLGTDEIGLLALNERDGHQILTRHEAADVSSYEALGMMPPTAAPGAVPLGVAGRSALVLERGRLVAYRVPSQGLTVDLWAGEPGDSRPGWLRSAPSGTAS